MPAAVLKPAPKAEELALLPAWFCLEILLREDIIIGTILVTTRLAVGNLCVLLDIVRSLCHVFGAPRFLIY